MYFNFVIFTLMATAYLLTGSNLGDRKLQLQQAATHIAQQAGTIVSTSLCYETAPWGKTDQPAFLNQALCLNTPLPPRELLQSLLSIELLMGRVRSEKYGPRIIDIDILLYDDCIVQEEQLIIPHGELPYRRFALLPLCELAPQFWHPVIQRTIETLLKQCPDQSAVQAIV